MSAWGTMGYDRTATGTAGIPFGEYRLIRRLGAGGMAEVFLAKREGPGGFEKNLVIKRILPHLSASPHFTELFLKEARLAALIDHPNLVHVSSFGQIDGQYYLAMEYVDGFTVADLLSRVGLLTAGVACRIAIDLLGALQAIHAARDEQGRPMQLVHRDVSARNVMLTRDGAVKLLDFGIAVTREDEALSAMGTQRYMAPEQQSALAVDHRADLFGVGVVLYELICGETPPGTSEGAIARPGEITEALWPTVSRLLAPSPDRRPGSAREVQAELEIFVGSRGLEGTRAHLADVIDQLAPRSAPLRVLSRITQLTSLTRLTRATDGSMGAPARGPGRAAIVALASLLAAAIGVLAVFRGRAEPEREPPAPPPPPPAITVAVSAPPVITASVAERPVERRAVRRRRAQTGRLTIDTRPWTQVYLGRRMLGMTPVVDVKLPAGRHELTLKNEELGLVRRITVTIRPNRTTRIQRGL